MGRIRDSLCRNRLQSPKTGQCLTYFGGLSSWRVIFDPSYAARLAKCGIQILDSPSEVVPLVLRYLGKDPNSRGAQDLAEVERVLMAVRPFIRNGDTSGYLEALANGDLCAVVGYNGDFVQARRRATEARNDVHVAYALPDEGSVVYFNMLAIPRGAPHAANALKFIAPVLGAKISVSVTSGRMSHRLHPCKTCANLCVEVHTWLQIFP